MLNGLIKRLEEEQTELASDEAHQSSLTASDTPKTCKGHCPRCGEDTNAEIVTSHSEHSDWEVIWAIDRYQVLRCLGCERVYFRHAYYFSEAENHHGDIDPLVAYWPPPKNREQPSWLDQLSDELLRDLLDEIYGALDADHRVLAAIGTRTALDRAMVLKGADEAQGFGEKLDQLLDKGIISDDEKKILGKLTDAGSAAAHRGWKPEPKELATLIDGVETFLHRALVLEKDVHAMEDVMPPKPRRKRKSKGGPES